MRKARSRVCEGHAAMGRFSEAQKHCEWVVESSLGYVSDGCGEIGVS